jgi:O-6-methylguanine DNA methyltransferase
MNIDGHFVGGSVMVTAGNKAMHQNNDENMHKDNRFFYEKIDTVMGEMLVVADENALYRLRFWDALSRSSDDFIAYQNAQKQLQMQHDQRQSDITAQVQSELQDYFNGRLKQFTTPLYLMGTAFQKQAWAALQQIPYGETISYGMQAASMNNPKAVRAVGSANGKNPVPIIVPCHRVIAHNQGLGGYTGGLDKKRFLLQCEGVVL